MLEDNFRQMIPFGICHNGDRAWFYNYKCGVIVELFLPSMEGDIIWIAGRRRFMRQNQYGAVAYSNGRLIFAPRNADEILIYDTNNGIDT